MDYLKIYESLITKARTRILCCYSESHHIIPKCIGGTDDDTNLVDLTPEEHYVAHQLLAKLYPNNMKIAKAVAMMVPNRPNNKMYGWVRRKLAAAQKISQSGVGNSQYGTKWITNGTEEKKIGREDIVPNGWANRRLSSYKKQTERQKKKELKDSTKLAAKIEELRYLHGMYVVGGFDSVVNGGYKHSKQNLVMQFAKYLPEFVPQNGKKR
jgi:hypothetical protein